MPDPFDSPMPELIGRQIRDLRILEQIGQGGMGAVYMAEHVLLHEPRAVKVMKTELLRSIPKAVERFEREARIAVKLRHPNLVLLYDFFVEEDHHFLVMEYVVGTSLAAFLRDRGALSVEGACRIGMQCCAGLAHAHEMGIVHRDLSPENVMLASSSAGLSVKIIDFGVARAAIGGRGQGWIQADRTITGVGEFIGKPRYASPEQAGALRRGETLDHRSDLYTLGLILYEMTTGTGPFQADSAFDYLAHHVHTVPARPSDTAPDLRIPAALDEVILRCLEKERDRRFATAGDLAAALEWAWRSGDPREAPFAIRSGPRDRGSRSRLAAIAAGVIVAALAVGAAGLWWTGRRDAGRSPVLASAPREELARTAPPVRDEIPPRGEVEPLATAPVEPGPATVAPAPVEPALVEPAPIAPEPAPAEAKPAPEPEPAPAQAKPAPVAPKPKPALAESKPAARSEPRVVAFASESEMQRAFADALEFERTHDASAAIANWKQFRIRSPKQELDEQAKRRITELTLGSLPGFR